MAVAVDALQRRVMIATSAQLGVKAAHLVLNVLSTLIVIRYLPPDAFGVYVIVLTTSLLAGLVGEFGLPKLAVREIMRRPDDRDAILGTVIGLRFAFAAVGTVVSQVVLLVVGASTTAHVAALIAAGTLWFDVLYTIIVVTHTEMRQQVEALLRLLMEIVEIVVLVVLVRAEASLALLFLAPVAGAATGAVGAQVVARRRFGVRPHFAKEQAIPLLREACVIGPTVIIGVAYLKADGLILATRRPTSEVAAYGAAAQPIEYLFLASAVVIGVIFPLLAKAFADGRSDRFWSSYRIGTQCLLCGSLFVPVTVALSGASIVDVAYSGKYPGAATPLLVLSIAFVLMVGNGWRSFVLLAAGQQAVTLRYDLAACVVALVSGLLLVGRFGATGAASATLATAAFVTIASIVAVNRRIGMSLTARPIVVSVLAAGAAGGIGAASSSIGAGPFVRSGLAIATYAVLVAAFARPSLHELVSGESRGGAQTIDLRAAVTAPPIVRIPTSGGDR